MKTMRVTYIYHSGFAVEAGDTLIVIDYYRDPASVLPRLMESWGSGRSVIFAVSHHHADHFNTEIFKFASRRGCRYVLSDDIPVTAVPSGADVTFVRPGSDVVAGSVRVRAFGSTDAGVSLLFETDGRRVFHSGDLNDWHWQDESTPDEVAEADSAFDAEVARVAKAAPRIDVMMMAVDPRMGTDFPRGARKMVRMINVGFFIPMHYWERPAEACDFKSYANPDRGRYICLSAPGESAVIDFDRREYEITQLK
ncbi:MAG: MBL fold metallo-hydrolase [Pseudoflavonifractor sp.]|nr:MBL fold metallo-hydrolase [Pseudoflavonifractor sp.]